MKICEVGFWRLLRIGLVLNVPWKERRKPVTHEHERRDEKWRAKAKAPDDGVNLARVAAIAEHRVHIDNKVASARNDRRYVHGVTMLGEILD